MRDHSAALDDTGADEGEADDAAFDALVCEVVAKLESGERVELSTIAARSPTHAERLSQLMPALEAMATLGAGVASTKRSRSGTRPLSLQSGETPGDVIGDFRVVRQIGRGGMGVVYEAEQISIGRRVALKVLSSTALIGEQQLTRFKNEARAAGTLKHPNIVSVYSVGTDRGLHYYAMELVEGKSLDIILAQLRKSNRGDIVNRSEAPHGQAVVAEEGRTEVSLAALSSDGRTDSSEYFSTIARLGSDIADALQHAHGQGIIHRDIKPANLLLDQSGRVWITDFGLARIENDVALTVAGDLIGTLRYMPPEQALGGGLVDHRADIYSLGATLYELVTLSPLYTSCDRAELLQQIATSDPRSPRQLNKRIPVDLETIIRKATERDIGDRYSSAQALRDDLQRFVRGEPILARPISLAGRMVKWSRRHHVSVAIAALAAALLTTILAIATVTIERSRARTEVALQESAEHQEQLADLLYAADIGLAAQAWQDNDIVRARELLERQIPTQGGADRRDLAWYFLRSLSTAKSDTVATTNTAIYHFELSPDGSQLATVGQDAILRVYDWRDRRKIASIDTHQEEVNGVTYLNNGTAIATTGDDGTLCVWKNLSDTPALTIPAHEGIAYNVIYSPVNDRLVTGGEDGRIRIWVPSTGKSDGELMGHTAPVSTLALSKSGKLLASASRDHTVRLWDLESGKEIRTMQVPYRAVSLAFDSEDEILAVGMLGHFNDQLFLIRIEDWEIANIDLPVKETDSVAFSPDGRYLAAGTEGGVIWLWQRDPTSLEPSASTSRIWSAHGGKIYRLAFTPDGEHLISASADGSIQRWADPADRISKVEHSVLEGVNAASGLMDGPHVAVAGNAGVGIFDLNKGEMSGLLSSKNEPFASIHVSENGRIVAAGRSDQNSVSVWRCPAAEGAVFEEYRNLRDLPGHRVCLSPNGDTLAVYSIGQDDGLVLVNLETGERRSGLVTHGCREVAWSPDGEFLVAAENHTDAILIFDSKTGQPRHRIAYHQETIDTLAISPDSRFIASADDTRHTALWDAADGRKLWSSTVSATSPSRGYPCSLLFTPSGNALLILTSEGSLVAFHVETGRELFQFDESPAASSDLALCGKGRFLCFVQNGQLTSIDTEFVWPSTRPPHGSRRGTFYGPALR